MWQRAGARRKALSDLTPDQLRDIGYSEANRPILKVKASLMTKLIEYTHDQEMGIPNRHSGSKYLMVQYQPYVQNYSFDLNALLTKHSST